jgi:Spc97 / Spc98 family.
MQTRCANFSKYISKKCFVGNAPKVYLKHQHFFPLPARSVKHYFLLDQGDFIVQFMDSCEAELSKNIDDIVPTRLESLLELALRTSAANGDPYKDDMRTELLPYDLMFQMFKILSIETHEEKGECMW